MASGHSAPPLVHLAGCEEEVWTIWASAGVGRCGFQAKVTLLFCSAGFADEAGGRHLGKASMTSEPSPGSVLLWSSQILPNHFPAPEPRHSLGPGSPVEVFLGLLNGSTYEKGRRPNCQNTSTTYYNRLSPP